MFPVLRASCPDLLTLGSSSVSWCFLDAPNAASCAALGSGCKHWYISERFVFMCWTHRCTCRCTCRNSLNSNKRVCHSRDPLQSNFLWKWGRCSFLWVGCEISHNTSYNGIRALENIPGLLRKEILEAEVVCSVPALSRHHQTQSVAIQIKSVRRGKWANRELSEESYSNGTATNHARAEDEMQEEVSVAASQVAIQEGSLEMGKLSQGQIIRDKYSWTIQKAQNEYKVRYSLQGS